VHWHSIIKTYHHLHPVIYMRSATVQNTEQVAHTNIRTSSNILASSKASRLTSLTVLLLATPYSSSVKSKSCRAAAPSRYLSASVVNMAVGRMSTWVPAMVCRKSSSNQVVGVEELAGNNAGLSARRCCAQGSASTAGNNLLHEDCLHMCC